MLPVRAKSWETYEEVANFVLNQIATQFDLDWIEGKQTIFGHISGTKWKLDGKGVCKKSEKFVIIETRRFTRSRLSQEMIGGLAYRIRDTGSAGGMLVSPLGLQKGAKKIAEREGICDVILELYSTHDSYTVKFLDKILIRPKSASVVISASDPTVHIRKVSLGAGCPTRLWRAVDCIE